MTPPTRRRPRRVHRALLSLAVLPTCLAAGVAWAQDAPGAGCAAALASDGQTIDGLPMGRWASDGYTEDLGVLDGRRIVLCRASGPRELLPLQNAVGCLLADGQVARVGERLACGAYQTMERPGDTILWTAHASATTVQVTPLRWNGDSFTPDAPFIACADFPLRPVQNPDQPNCGGPPR